MRPYVVQGHSRPVTWVVYNREGDLLVTCARDKEVCLWFQEDGTRLGSFQGHDGVVYTADIASDSERLLTASGDGTTRLWQMETGKELFEWHSSSREPCRAVSFAVGERLAAFSTDPFGNNPPGFHIVRVEEDMLDQTEEKLVSEIIQTRIYRLGWTDQNRVIVTAQEDGFVRRWDVETGKIIFENRIHAEQINDLRFSGDGTHFITGSSDKTAKLVDTRTLEVLKTYKSGTPVNAVDMSPLMDHVVLGGGQDAADVTTTAAQAGNFSAKFYHKLYEEEFGTVRGHFGPLNSVAFHPSGRGFTTGGEDGFVRIHHFDDDYFTTKFF
ncbi:unnamed protein product [Ostreobium quekettii]|uniref:Eukaryotic translation initiation factor 3 subunit I n=1 Tax=Ostreobium quekettii TaxID=121088 RepID=A0A8S1JEF0_9CHLO|nr:unnamed protein product [Ostreobium quekettii]|eukprot:evm.model.scf_274.3 EVM.evm.TU.scf_274.3   scf_274:19162-23056(-)